MYANSIFYSLEIYQSNADVNKKNLKRVQMTFLQYAIFVSPPKNCSTFIYRKDLFVTICFSYFKMRKTPFKVYFTAGYFDCIKIYTTFIAVDIIKNIS